MNSKLFLLWFVCVLPFYTTACDMCGCFMGITPYDNQSSVQLLHRYRAFNGYYGHQQEHHWFPVTKTTKPAAAVPVNMSGQTRHTGSTAAETPVYAANDYEIYQTTELRAKYFLHQRIEVNAFTPLNNFSSREGDERIHSIGLGDITVYSGFHVLRRI